MSNLPVPPATDFIREAINEDLASGRFNRVHTRFPPEPNGYLHIGHAKSICLNFGLAQAYGGKFNLRFDDTNPSKEEMEYVDSIKEDVRWLGFDWEDRELYASDYFEQLYEWAELLVQKGLAYVCDLSAEEVREYRGTLTEPGKDSPFRSRPVEENLDLFRRMRAGEFPDGSRTLRAKIDMAHPNLNMRDPVLYRILRATHHRTGDAWCIYPMYDYAHGQSDSIEGITHSICTLEFEVHRPLYDWFIQAIGIYAPRQIEFARLNLTYTMMCKRKLLQLVQEGVVRGWDDPRMPTICGLRRRGYTPTAIRDFCARIGVAKRDSVVDVALLEHCLREELNRTTPRVMAVLRPLKLVLDNYPEGQVEEFEVPVNPESPEAGTRRVPFSRVLYIEQDDFREVPPPKYWRLFPGNEVRLRSAYLVRCTRGGEGPGHRRGRRGARHRSTPTPGAATPRTAARSSRPSTGSRPPMPCDAEVRLYEHLFTTPDPGDVPEGGDWRDNLNPASVEILTGCKLEPGLAQATAGDRFQFERLGYFVVDPDSAPGRLVFNRSVTLRDTWARIEKIPVVGAACRCRDLAGRRLSVRRSRDSVPVAGRSGNLRPELRLTTGRGRNALLHRQPASRSDRQAGHGAAEAGDDAVAAEDHEDLEQPGADLLAGAGGAGGVDEHTGLHPQLPGQGADRGLDPVVLPRLHRRQPLGQHRQPLAQARLGEVALHRLRLELVRPPRRTAGRGRRSRAGSGSAGG